MKRRNSMKDTELKLICELMKNGRRSDRELGKAIGVSQPTISRTIKKLEKEGMIKEYTMIPDFRKLGFEIMAVTFVKYLKELSDAEHKELRLHSREREMANRQAVLLAMNGLGLGNDAVFISFHKSYSSYAKALSEVKAIPHVDPTNLQSFMINLTDEQHFQPLTLSTIANYLLKTGEER